MYKELFKEKGIKNTKQRFAVIKVLEKHRKPMSAEEIYDTLMREGIDINLSTIYRILDTFHEKEIVVKTSLYDDKKTHFDLKRDEHTHYLICTKCKCKVALSSCPFKTIEAELKAKTDFIITGHKIEIYGCCPKCIDDEA